MKRTITLILILACFYGQGQSFYHRGAEVLVANSTTSFGKNIVTSVIITDVSTGKGYFACKNIASTKTIATCIVNDPGGYSELLEIDGLHIELGNYIWNASFLQSVANINITGNILTGGSITAAGGGFNSLRLIKDIHPDWTGSALKELSKFKLRDFNYKSRPNQDRTLGFIVDEIPDSISNYVLMGKNRDAINTYSMIGLIVKALQEANVKIESLEKRLEKSEGRSK
jgi:hypothetical protein